MLTVDWKQCAGECVEFLDVACLQEPALEQGTERVRGCEGEMRVSLLLSSLFATGLWARC